MRSRADDQRVKLARLMQTFPYIDSADEIGGHDNSSFEQRDICDWLFVEMILEGMEHKINPNISFP